MPPYMPRPMGGLSLITTPTGVMNPPARESNQTQECRHKRGFAERLRGGGAGKVRTVYRHTTSESSHHACEQDCFLGLIECFLCFGEWAPCRLGCAFTDPPVVVRRMLQSKWSRIGIVAHRSHAWSSSQDCCECIADIVCTSLTIVSDVGDIDVVPLQVARARCAAERGEASPKARWTLRHDVQRAIGFCFVERVPSVIMYSTHRTVSKWNAHMS